MGWGRMDDGFDDHPKVVAILDEEDQALAGVAVGVWTLCWAWAHRNTRKPGKIPGLVPAGLPRRFLGSIGRKSVELLVKHGLWDEHESGGWLFHDFADYLPTDSTRDARSEAGKLGAAARWGKRGDAGNAGNAPAQDGNLPSTCHGEDGNAVANDGSRAGARRDPTPTPTPHEEPPSEVLVGREPAEPAKPKKRAPKPATPATRIPDNFAVTPEMVAWASTDTPLVDGRWETAQFVDYWKAADGRTSRKKDWVAAWRTWMRKAQKDAENRRPRVPSQQPRQEAIPSGYSGRSGIAAHNVQQPPMGAQARKANWWLERAAELDAQHAQGGVS